MIQKWFCIANDYDMGSYASHVVVAGNAREAAVKAAERAGLEGEWTVVPGEPRTVHVQLVKSYDVLDSE